MSYKLISAINIHNGGGLTYLYLLHPFLDSKFNTILFDERAKSKLPIFKKAKLIFLKKGLFRNMKVFAIRIRNYFIFHSSKVNNNHDTFYTEIYLNGIPPLFRLFPKGVDIYIFMQNKLIFEKITIKKLTLNNLFVFLNIYISKILLFIFIKKTDILIAQTNSMQNILAKNFLKNRNIRQEEIWGAIDQANFELINRFLKNNSIPIISKIKKLSNENLIFFYPASLYEHKNHRNLFEAVRLLELNSIKKFKLILTIKESDLKIFSIKNKSNILCLGEVDYFDLLGIYKLVDFLIFPSTSESFGLPLLEAKFNNTKIIASNLEYVYDVCNPTFVFDPNEPRDIFEKLQIVLKETKKS